jgi:hypothetical protein
MRVGIQWPHAENAGRLFVARNRIYVVYAACGMALTFFPTMRAQRIAIAFILPGHFRSPVISNPAFPLSGGADGF